MISAAVAFFMAFRDNAQREILAVMVLHHSWSAMSLPVWLPAIIILIATRTRTDLRCFLAVFSATANFAGVKSQSGAEPFVHPTLGQPLHRPTVASRRKRKITDLGRDERSPRPPGEITPGVAPARRTTKAQFTVP
jgi:hypothetical protein